MKKLAFWALILILFPLTYFSFEHFKHQRCDEIRYSFDIGTGAMKSRVALVDTCENTVLKVYAKSEKPTRFESNMVVNAAGENEITQDCIGRVIAEFDQMQNDYNMSCLKEKCAGVATAWARKTSNANDLVKKFQEKGLNLVIVSQEEEGILSFEAVRHSQEMKDVDFNKVIVWDMGGGSFQLTTLDNQGAIHVYRGPHGVESLDKEIRRVFHNPNDQERPYFSAHKLEEAIDYVKQYYGAPISTTDPLIAAKLNDPEVIVIAVGGPFSRGLKEQMDFPEEITVEDITNSLIMFDNQTTQVIAKQYPRLPDFYRVPAQSSLILIKGIMLGANIQKARIMGVGLSDYVLTNKAAWN